MIDKVINFLRSRSCAERLLKAEAEIFRLRNVIDEANNALFDTSPHDVEHSITCHADTLPQEFRRVAGGHETAFKILQESILEYIKG